MDMRYQGLQYDHKDVFDVYKALINEVISENNEQWIPMQQGLGALFSPPLIARSAIIGGKRAFKALNQAIDHALK